jgi:inner membrane protein
MLPDIVDKPLGFLFLDYFSNTRLFGHTLLFNVLLIALGLTLLLLFRRGGVLTLALASLAHLVQDRMWEEPVTLFWPLLGFAFPKEEMKGFTHAAWEKLSDPGTYIPEIIGALMLMAILGLLVLRRHRVASFLRRGRLA